MRRAIRLTAHAVVTTVAAHLGRRRAVGQGHSGPWRVPYRSRRPRLEVESMGHGGNVLDELVADHREVEDIFGRIEALPSGDKDRKVYADQATRELVRHSVAEEEYLCPAVRSHLVNGDTMADREIEDHARAERIMKELEGCEAGDPEFDRLVGRLMSEVRAHIADEEQSLFPQLRVVCPASTLDDLGDKVRTARMVAPTRPHPAAPDTPEADKPPAPGAGLVDRLRDALTGRGRPD